MQWKGKVNAGRLQDCNKILCKKHTGLKRFYWLPVSTCWELHRKIEGASIYCKCALFEVVEFNN